jgi:hypothetical protein
MVLLLNRQVEEMAFDDAMVETADWDARVSPSHECILYRKRAAFDP